VYEIKYKDYIKSLHDGKKYCHSCALKLFNSGHNNGSYNPNLSDEERLDKRNYPEYTDFIKVVLARDNYICQCCGKELDHDAEVHHLYGYSGFPEYKTDQTQAITLCKNCHASFHSWHRQQYGREDWGNCTREQYEKWYGKALDDLKKYDGILPPTRRVYCYEEDKVYDSSRQYAELHNVTITSVNQVCNRKNRWSLKSNHLFWYDEYVNMSIDNINKIINHLNRNSIKVICITTGIIFGSLLEAASKYELKFASGIALVCNGKRKHSGKLPDGTPLQWMYYEDFLKLPIKEQNKILNRNQEPSIDGSFTMQFIANHT
jgi:5-methylcytosine-specific restriction endonuclease McrA